MGSILIALFSPQHGVRQSKPFISTTCAKHCCACAACSADCTMHNSFIHSRSDWRRRVGVPTALCGIRTNAAKTHGRSLLPYKGILDELVKVYSGCRSRTKKKSESRTGGAGYCLLVH